MQLVERRDFLKLLAIAGAGSALNPSLAFGLENNSALQRGSYSLGRVPNEYSLYLAGEKEALEKVPSVAAFTEGGLTAKLGTRSQRLRPGETLDGWQLLTIVDMNGVVTAVFEKHVTHRGVIAYVTEHGGTIAFIPKLIGDLSKVRPRPTNVPDKVRLERAAHYVPGPDTTGLYVLNSADDPSYETVAALGAEYIGWTLVANEQGGPMASLYLDAAGTSREIGGKPNGEGTWQQDQTGPYFDPSSLFPWDTPQLYQYTPGYSKRTLLGGYLPVADIAVWNPKYQSGYETMLLLPPGADAKPIGRVRVLIPADLADRYSADPTMVKSGDGKVYLDRYWNCTAQSFFAELAGIWNRWSSLYELTMPVSIPDEWLLNAARAGITLSRCSYRGLEPTYQIGEGAYTKIPERSHALFPVAQYEFIWAQQVWNLNDDADAYFQFYLDKYVLPNGDFVYNTQDQVEAPLNVGIFLVNSARSFDYTKNVASLEKRLPALERMIAFVLQRYEYSKQHFPSNDRRYGLIYGSPEADLGDPHNDFPESHPYYYQNSVCTWRGLAEHSRCLRLAGQQSKNDALLVAAAKYEALAKEMRANIEASLAATLALRSEEMRASGITPFTPFDVDHKPTNLSSYENHRFMQDFFLADWGDNALDVGHLKHRELAGMQIVGLHTDGAVARTSNFMDHGSLSVKIRQEDYRPFLLNLYALVCYAADSGNFYSPEDAYVPGSYPGDGGKYGWASVINSTLQPTVGLRMLLCYEEANRDICHLQKAAPKHWFAKGQTISVAKCPTRFGQVDWTTQAVSDSQWKVKLHVPTGFSGDIHIHIHPPGNSALHRTSAGNLEGDSVVLNRAALSAATQFEIDIT